MTKSKTKTDTRGAGAKTAGDSVQSPSTNPEAVALTLSESKLVQARLVTTSLQQAAKAAGIPYVTAWRTWQKAHVRVGYMNACRQVHEDALRKLQGLSVKAVEELERLLKARSQATRLQAIRLVLSSAARASDLLDISSRLDALESK